MLLGGRRGFSLVEVALSGTLALLLIGMLTSALMPVLRYSMRSSHKSELVQAALKVTHALFHDLEKTNIHGLTVAHRLVAIHAKVAVSEKGAAIWDHQGLIVYQWIEEDLVRRIFKPHALMAAAPFRLDPAELPSLQPLEEKVILKGLVHRFFVERNRPVRLSLELANNQDRYNHSESIFLRNEG